MVQAVRMPMMGNTMETGVLVEWKVDEGDEVTEDQPIAEVESEKTSADVAASQDGTLARIDVEEGEEVPPGTVLGVVLGPDESLDEAPEPRSQIEEEGEAGTAETEAAEAEGETAEAEAETEAAAPSGEEKGVRAAPGARKLASEHDIDLTTIEGSGEEGAVLRADVEEHIETAPEAEEAAEADVSSAAEQQFASPSTRRLARELGVTLADVEGTGIEGRITESDVRRAGGQIEEPTTTATTPAAGTGGGGVSGPATRDAERLGVTVAEERPLSGMRETIAERMAQSARQAPHVTLNREVDVERAFETADELADVRDAPIGFTDVLVGATVRALDAHPELNSWFEDDTQRLIDERNVAVAVDTEAGLLTPVIRSADERSLDGIATERRRLTEAVLEGEHSMDDLQGGTFTITNLGMFGIDSFDPIINPPQIAILGVGRVRDDGDGRTCTLSLSFDHRVVDGADAARFLDTLTNGLEAPSLVVAERSAAEAGERTAAVTPSSAQEREPEPDTIGAAIAADLEDRAREVAAAHDWPVPGFEVQLDSGRPSITVDAPSGAAPATMKRLTYAACRESQYADVVTNLRDADVSVV